MFFTPEPGEVRRARREVARFLESNGVAPELSERALLVASELVTNALEASSPAEEIELVVTAGRSVVTIDVENVCEVDPATIASIASVAMPAPFSERGRGLPLVAASATRLSITFRPGRVRVGADIVELS